ncbi:MAG TPA: hypothetical protein VF698_14510 [Thermoanaerobaculia bacterium]|jgi:hypothetical protein
MKKLSVALTAVILLAVAAFAENESVSMTGEIVDLHCFTGSGPHAGLHGADHAGCANACLTRDVPPGFLADDGTLYLVVNEKMNSVKEKVAGKAGQKVTVTGKIVERSGMKVLQLATIGAVE